MIDRDEIFGRIKDFFSKYAMYFLYGVIGIAIVILIIALIPKKSISERAIAKLEDYIEENNITLTNEEQYFSFSQIGLKVDKNCFEGGIVIATTDGYKVLYICDNEYSSDLNKILFENEIVLAGQNPFYIKRGNFYVEPGYTEKNNVIVKTRDNIASTVGMYIVDYEGYGGNVPLKSKRIVIMTNDSFESYPIITLRGNKYETVLKGRNYQDPGFEAYDSKDGSINSNVTKVGTVNTSIAGLYQIRYSVTNSMGNSYETVRNVNVVKDETPVKFEYSITPTTNTSESVKINIKVSGINYRYVLKPNGSTTSLNDFDYDVTENGTYKFVIKRIDGDTEEKTITINNIEKKTEEEQEVETLKDLKIKISDMLPYLDTSNYEMFQVVTFAKGQIVETYSSGCSDNSQFYLSSATKSILGIVAAKMEEDKIISLDDEMSKYWYRLHDYNFASCSSEWRSMMGPEATVVDHTSSNRKLFQNGGTLRNFLTHSSTVMEMNMVHMNPNDDTSEYFGGSISSNYGRAAFMLHHSSGQLFPQGEVPGRTTNYNYQKDSFSREHSIAGFTMQIAMKESINEYIKRTILKITGYNSNPGFINGNSIYFAAGYKSSARDVASIIAAVASGGVYNNTRVFSKNTVKQLEIKYSNLGNQTIAFDYSNGKYFKYGNFTDMTWLVQDIYRLNDMYRRYASYISYDPVNGYGFIVTTKYRDSSKKNNALTAFTRTANYFYENAE